jgi:hypothetical protein
VFDRQWSSIIWSTIIIVIFRSIFFQLFHFLKMKFHDTIFVMDKKYSEHSIVWLDRLYMSDIVIFSSFFRYFFLSHIHTHSHSLCLLRLLFFARFSFHSRHVSLTWMPSHSTHHSKCEYGYVSFPTKNTFHSVQYGLNQSRNQLDMHHNHRQL